MQASAALAGVAVSALLASSLAAAAPGRDPAAARDAGSQLTGAYRILDQPGDGEETVLRNVMRRRAQERSDALFAALSSLLGGDAPALNFVRMGSPLVSPVDLSANVPGSTGAPLGTINIDPLATGLLLDDLARGHSAAVNGLPHEMGHLRQTPDVLASIPLCEGSAQAFADIVTPVAASRAGIPYSRGFPPGFWDGAYADYAKQARARGTDWILGGQFGRTAPAQWP